MTEHILFLYDEALRDDAIACTHSTANALSFFCTHREILPNPHRIDYDPAGLLAADWETSSCNTISICFMPSGTVVYAYHRADDRGSGKWQLNNGVPMLVLDIIKDIDDEKKCAGMDVFLF